MPESTSNDPAVSQPVAPSPVVTPIPSEIKKSFLKDKRVWVIGLIIAIIVIVAGVFVFLDSSKKTHEVAKEGKVYHVGVLSTLNYFFPQVNEFKQEMAKLGYIEGKNIIYDVHKVNSTRGNQAIIKKFVDDKADLIYVFPSEAAVEASDVARGTGIPIIATSTYFEGNGLIESISHPGGNLTGVRSPAVEMASKRLEILHQIAPLVKRVWIPHLKDYPTVAPSLDVIKPLAESLGMTIIETPFTDPKEVTAYLASRTKGDAGMDAIVFVPEPGSLIPAYMDQIYAFANAHKLPIVNAVVLEGEYGPIAGLLPSNKEYGELAAPIADKILQGTDPGSIPIVTPDSDLSINLKVIHKLGLTIDEGLLSTAKQIVH